MRKVTSVETSVTGYSRGDVIYDLELLNNELTSDLELDEVEPSEEEDYIKEWLENNCYNFVKEVNVIRDDREYELQGFELGGIE